MVPRYWPYLGGSERWFQEISERLAADGHQVTVLTTDAWDLEYFWDRHKQSIPVKEEAHNGVVIRRLPVRHLPFSGIVFPGTRRVMCWLARGPRLGRNALFPLGATTPLVPSLPRALSRLNPAPEIVHAATVPFDSLVYYAQQYARSRGIPFIMSPQTHLGEPESDEVRRHYTLPNQIEMMRRSTFVIVRTDIERDSLQVLGVPRDKMVRIPAGAEPREMTGTGARFRKKHGLHQPIVFSLGALAYDKGSMTLVEAMKLLWSEGLKADLVMAGPLMEPFRHYMEAQPDEVKARCLIPGFVSLEEKADLLDAGDVFVMASRTDSFGIVYLEAWLNRKPVIGAWAGGVPDVISQGQDGFLVRFGDAAELAMRIKQLLGDRELAEKMGRRGEKKTLESYTWDRVYEQALPLYVGQKVLAP
ncbi:MAG: glycosyltransferase family 4 protein [Dehalococcoidia bacterium]|nr:glycosyltransferase family 4 protein [Dehalococcoidia bacterium]